jgi:hypothetical protein
MKNVVFWDIKFQFEMCSCRLETCNTATTQTARAYAAKVKPSSAAR